MSKPGPCAALALAYSQAVHDLKLADRQVADIERKIAAEGSTPEREEWLRKAQAHAEDCRERKAHAEADLLDCVVASHGSPPRRVPIL